MQCWGYHLLFDLHLILCEMDIKLFRRENGHLKGILIFVISYLMWHFTDTAVTVSKRKLACVLVNC